MEGRSSRNCASCDLLAIHNVSVTGKVLHRIIVLLVRFVLLARFGLLNFGLFLYSWVNKFFAPFYKPPNHYCRENLKFHRKTFVNRYCRGSLNFHYSSASCILCDNLKLSRKTLILQETFEAVPR